MLVMTEKYLKLSDSVDYQNLDKQWIFWVSLRTLVADVLWRHSMLKINGLVVKAMHTASPHNILLESLLSDVLMWTNVIEMFVIMTDPQAIDVVTIDFKGIRVRCVVSGSADYQMNDVKMHGVLN